MPTAVATDLLSRQMEHARSMLVRVCALLESRDIPYHLEGGTLLGLVRDGDLLPWDHDVDISVPAEYATAVSQLRWALLRLGLLSSARRSRFDHGPIARGQLSLFKVKPILGYCLKWFWPRHELIVLDIFVKMRDATHTYWQAKEKVMRVENAFYASHDTIDWRGSRLRVPNRYRDYLTAKYGDWSTPVREWDCATNEGTLVG